MNELEESEARFRSIFEQAAVGMAIIDSETGRFLRVNDKYTRIIGFTEAEMCSSNFMAISHPEELGADLDQMARLKRGEIREFSMEKRLFHKDGTEVWVDLSVSPLGRGPVRHHLAVVVDIDARKRLEVQLRQAQKMEAVGTLAGGIAHDFNNLLTMVSLNTELLRTLVTNRSAVEPTLRSIDVAVERAELLVKQILTFGRRQVGSRVVLGLNDAITETARFLRATLPKGLELKLDLTPQTPRISADPTQVQQVLINLGTNAWQANQRGVGIIGLYSSVVTIDSSHGPVPQGRYARVRVTDDGAGMTPEVLGRIFEPFFTTRSASGGTGLGLSVVHGIVAEHGGAIHVESTVGVGTTIDVFFPLAAAEVTVTDPNDTSARAGHGERVLLVDDEELIVRSLSRLLTVLGYSPIECLSPHDAIAVLRSDRHLDVMLTDLNMPAMSGFELAMESKVLRPTLPVVLASGYLPPESDLSDKGISAVMAKPFDAKTLTNVLVPLLKRR